MSGCPASGDDYSSATEGPPPTLYPMTASGEQYMWNKIRLPEFIRPYHYNIHLQPNLTTLDVTGTVDILLQLTEEKKFVVMHSRNLAIIGKALYSKNHTVNVTRMLTYEPYQQIYLEFNDTLKKGQNYTLKLHYTTKLSMELEGFYISSYVNSKKERKYLATTHFEPTYARSAFPCFDEPHLKAAFKMRIVREYNQYALSNMPVQKSDIFFKEDQLMIDEFFESVEMSTYLVAFVVCDYARVKNTTKSGVTVRVLTPPDQINQAKFALSIAVKIMDYYEEFFGVPYPLPKQDLIAIPDFNVGAMENWGLITYRETSILYDSVESSSAAHQWVAVVVAHELAHQWFGNLVTMKWWNDLWLNEGFASFIEYLGVHHAMPEWRMMEQFILDKTQPALSLDALNNSHPISVHVYDPSEIESIFDTISYNKGASIIYMLEHVLGEATLRRGLMDYLNNYKFGNADTNDWWNMLSQSSNDSIEVKEIMGTWTNQAGFPLITIRRRNNTIEASQDLFLMTWQVSEENNETTAAPTPSPSKNSSLWYVPLSYITDVEPHQTYYIWMNRTQSVFFDIPAHAKWIKCNVNQTGFYRVMYGDEDVWSQFAQLLLENHTVFSPADRASLIDDAFTLCRAGYLNASIPLLMATYLRNETEYVPWATALGHLWSWTKYLYEQPAHFLFLKYLCWLIDPIYHKVGWNDAGSHLDKLLRSDILAAAIHCENKHAIQHATSKFRSWMEHDKKVAPNLREVVYCSGVKYGGLREWEHCWIQYNKTVVPSEKKLLLKAMGVSSDPWILTQYLAACLDRERVRPQDVRTVLSVVAANPHGRLLAWRHLRAHWSHWQGLFGHGSMTMGNLITSVVAHFATEFDYDEVSTFFRHLDVGSAVRALGQSLEMIRLNAHWTQNNEQEIQQWLKEHVHLS